MRSIEEIDEEIAEKTKLLPDLVGNLYGGIVKSQLRNLYRERTEAWLSANDL